MEGSALVNTEATKCNEFIPCKMPISVSIREAKYHLTYFAMTTAKSAIILRWQKVEVGRGFDDDGKNTDN